MYVIQITHERVKASNPALHCEGYVISTWDHDGFVNYKKRPDKVRYFATRGEAEAFLDVLTKRRFHMCYALIPTGHIKVHVRHADLMAEVQPTN